MPAFLVFQRAEGPDAWQQVGPQAVESPTADAAIETARTGPGTFVAVLARSFRPRTHYTPPRPPAAPKPIRETL